MAEIPQFIKDEWKKAVMKLAQTFMVILFGFAAMWIVVQAFEISAMNAQ